jgi:hypothetical protein
MGLLCEQPVVMTLVRTLHANESYPNSYLRRSGRSLDSLLRSAISFIGPQLQAKFPLKIHLNPPYPSAAVEADSYWSPTVADRWNSTLSSALM